MLRQVHCYRPNTLKCILLDLESVCSNMTGSSGGHNPIFGVLSDLSMCIAAQHTFCPCSAAWVVLQATSPGCHLHRFVCETCLDCKQRVPFYANLSNAVSFALTNDGTVVRRCGTRVRWSRNSCPAVAEHASSAVYLLSKTNHQCEARNSIFCIIVHK